MLGLVTCFYCNGVVFFPEEIVPKFGWEGGPGVCEALLAFAEWSSPLSNEEILPNFGEGGGPGVCEVLGLVTSFYCNGVVLSTEESLSNFGEGGGPGVCEVLGLLTCIAAME